MHSKLVILLLSCAALAAAQAERGEVGDFTTLEHGVSGTIHILDSRTIYFENFAYDGQGPDTVLYYYAPGVAVDPMGGGVVINLTNPNIADSSGRFQMRPYSNENFMVTLPPGTTTCDIGTLTVWCRQANVLFSRIAIPASTFVNDGANPCRAIGSAEIGDFSTLAHGVSATVHLLDSTTIYLENFNYDGMGPDTFLYYYAPGVAVNASGGGVFLDLPQEFSDNQNRFLPRRFTNEGIVVSLPQGTTVCDIGSLTVWCQQASVIFAEIAIPRSTFVNNGECTVIADGSGGLLLNPVGINLSAERGEIGDFTTLAHGVSGTVHILSSNTILLQNFNYDGQAPDTIVYYYAPGVAVDATGGGVFIPLGNNTQFSDDQGRLQMREYNNEDILVTLPDGQNTCQIGVLSIWCRQAQVLFATISVPRTTFVNNGADPCQSIGSAEIGEINTLAHGVSGTVHILDSRTLYLENFNYDGQGPDTVLYSYAPGANVDPAGGGTVIPLSPSVGDSQGRFQMRRFTNEDYIVRLPAGMRACEIGNLSVWCREAGVLFGVISVPTTTFAEDGASPCRVIGDGSGGLVLNTPEFDNCISFHDTLQLSWRVDRANSSVRFRLCGCLSQEPDSNQYMGFGLSRNSAQTSMFGADPTITWVDKSTGEPNAVDYHLSAYRMCNNGVGACPDEMDSSGSCTNDITDIVGSASAGQQCVSFTRRFSTSDATCDVDIDPMNDEQYIVWGIGRISPETTVSQHFERANPTQQPIFLGREPRDDCLQVPLTCRGCPPFESKRIIAREDTTFTARIGPAGSDRGYMGITDRAGWGITWYINGTLIPELVVERGRTYTFMVEGGDNSNDASNYHPFYITDSIAGGRLRFDAIRNSETVYGGIVENGGSPPSVTTGKLCEYVETPQSISTRETCTADRDDYTRTLTFSDSSLCRTNAGEPGILEWTPDENTPDVVYYQCATHQNLGWRIVVEDFAPVHTISALVVMIVGTVVALMLL